MGYKGGKKLRGQGVDGNDLLGLSEAQLDKILGNYCTRFQENTLVDEDSVMLWKFLLSLNKEDLCK